jgi:N-acetylmuramoyl-L-alanine amidase
MKGPFFLSVLAAGLTGFYACSPKQYSSRNRSYAEQVKKFSGIIASPPADSVRADSLKIPTAPVYTVNFGMRKPNMVVLHYTAQNSCEKTIETFSTTASQVSAHYVICKDGTLHHMLNDYLRAWHAGVGHWGSNTDINSGSVGIEIDNDGKENYTAAQLNTLYGLLAYLKKAYNIPAANFIGHSDVAPGRKIDPGVLFPWKALSEKGYGLWYSDTTGINVPPGFNPAYALRIIGYDISNLPVATEAFRIHFLSVDKTGELDEKEKKVLYAVLLKFL